MEKLSRPVKLMILITGTGVGGAEAVVKGLMNGLDSKEYSPFLVSIRPFGRTGREIEAAGYPAFTLNARFKHNPLIIFRLLGIVRREKPDLINSHLYHANIVGRLVGRLSGVKVVSVIHNVRFGGPLRDLSIKATDAWSDENVCISDLVRSRMLKEEIVSRAAVIRNGIDPVRCSGEMRGEVLRKVFNTKGDHGDLLLLAVGRLEEQKAFSNLIEAVSVLDRDGGSCRLIILGEGSLRSRLERQIKSEGLEKKVALMGNVKNVARYYCSADMFVMPSNWEGLPVSLLEAMSAGMVCVATSVGGVPEVIKDGVDGYLLKDNEHSSIASTVKKVASLKKEKREGVSARAEAKVEDKFSFQRMVKSYQAIFDKALSN